MKEEGAEGAAQVKHMSTTLVPLIPEFSGAKGGIHLRKLLKYINQYAVVEGWNDNHKLAVLNAKCIGEAGVVLDSAHETPKTFDEAVALLTERFLPKISVSRLIPSLTEAKQRPDESIMRFVDRLMFLMKKAQGTYTASSGDANVPEPVSKLIEETIVATLQKGLRSERVKAALIATEPATLAEARSTLKRLEAREEEFFPNKKSVGAIQKRQYEEDSDVEEVEISVGTPEEVTDQEATLTQVTALIKEAVTRMGNQNKSHDAGASGSHRETRTCWHCNKVGHLSRDCRKKQGNFQKGGKPKCFKCGKFGHIKADCRAVTKNSNSTEDEDSALKKGQKNSKTPLSESE